MDFNELITFLLAVKQIKLLLGYLVFIHYIIRWMKKLISLKFFSPSSHTLKVEAEQVWQLKNNKNLTGNPYAEDKNLIHLPSLPYLTARMSEHDNIMKNPLSVSWHDSAWIPHLQPENV